jgi:hypothetical protein
MVGAPGEQMTWAQKQSLAGIALSQEILSMEMSQQQHPWSTGEGRGTGGPWTGGLMAEAPSSSMGTTAKEKAFMVRFFFLKLFCLFCGCCLWLSGCRRGRACSTFIPSAVSYLKGCQEDVLESKTETVWEHLQLFLLFCLGESCCFIFFLFTAEQE